MDNRICVCISREMIEDALVEAKSMMPVADVLEIRLDMMTNPAIIPFIEKLDIPLLFTNRAEWEGGHFKGVEKERISFLLEAVDAGASYIDLELMAPADSWDTVEEHLSRSVTKLICSHHNFKATPTSNELLEILQQMKDSGADIAKIITTAHNFHDVLRVLALQSTASEMGLPLIAFCMGEEGRISRLATTSLGGYMTYCSTDSGGLTAPGQMKATVLRSIYSALEGKSEN